MKNLFRRAAAAVVIAVLLLPSALAADPLGSRLYDYTLDICDGTTLTHQVLWGGSAASLRTENFVTYTPNPSVSPKVSFGATIPTKQTVASMARDLEGKGSRVLSGINGDYFVMATGSPLGLVVTDGVLRSSASYLSAIGFRADGSAVAGKPDLKLRANFSGHSLKIAEINKLRSGEGYFLFTDDFGATTRNTRDGVDVILAPTGESGQTVSDADKTATLTTSPTLGIGKVVPCAVEEVIDASGATPIPAGKFVLSISDTGGDWLRQELLELRPGDPVSIEIAAPDPKWNDVDCAVGSMFHILSGGQVTSDQEAGSTSAPRTAVGVKADGSVIFYTVDGRQSGYSAGATSRLVAQRLAELGCVEGMLLDGGGSTTFVSTYPDQAASTTMNRPSEGAPRAVSNAIFLVSNLQATGQAGSLYVTPRDLVLLGGGSTQCGAVALDTGWRPMSALPGPVTWSAPEGSVSSSGVFTAPKKTGVYTVSAESGGVTGTTRVTVYDTPDAIRLTNAATGATLSSLNLVPGQTVDVNAAATYHTLTLKGDDTCYTWTTDAGTITPEGVLTAGNFSASGKLTIQAGRHVASIPVTVTASPRIRLVADFEDTGNAAEDRFFSGAENGTFTLSSQARLGSRSGRWAYTPGEAGATLTTEDPVPLSEADRYLAAWVYGDNSGDTLYALFPRENGSLAAQTTGLNFSGWKRVVFGIPSDAMGFSGFKVTGEKAGTLFLDQVVLANQAGEETTPPAVTLSVSGQNVSARVSDSTAAALSPRQAVLTLDGKRVEATYRNGTLTATLPDLGTSAHQVTVTVSDSCGNLARASRLLPGSAPCPFLDMPLHWAAPYVGRLAELHIVSGTGDGRFAPNAPVTRGDFALLAARWLGLDLTAYGSKALPFADAAAIPAWDRAAVAALYDKGIMKGSADAGGKVYANAKAPISRAEAFTLLSRMQPKGWPEASLAGFSDAGAVPAWAKSAVASLVGQKVVSGANGMLLPNANVSRAEVAKLLVSMW